jgi:hypothetical protein
MKMKLMILSTGAALLMSPMWAQEQQKSPTTAAQSQESSMKTWIGTLHDADCKTATPSAKCEVTSSTLTFGFMTADGKSYAKLDSDSNTKVSTALLAKKGRAATGPVKASITGSIEGELIKVGSVQIL